MFSLFLALSIAAPEGRTLIDRVIAVVNEDVITESELDMAAGRLSEATEEQRVRIRKETLEQLIADRLLGEQVKESKIEVSDEDIDRAIDDIARQNRLGKEEFYEALSSRGMSMPQYRSDLSRQLQRVKLIDLKVRSRVVVSDADIKSEFERRVGAEHRDEVVVLSHIYFRYSEGADAAEKARVIDKAKQARARVTKGEAFAAVAKEISEGPTRENGGDLGELSQQDLLPEMLRALRDMQPGEISAPIDTPSGVHVVQLREKKKKDAKSFESMRGEIHQQLYQQEVERQMKLWVDELRQAAAVSIRL